MALFAPRRARFLAALTLAAVLASAGHAAAAPTCTQGPLLSEAQREQGRYIYELRNNRQTTCGPPDFVEDPAEAGFSVDELCTEAAPTAGDTYIKVTVTFRDDCKSGSPERKLQVATLWRQCPGQDPLLQPWEAASITVRVETMPTDFSCTPSMSPIAVDKNETNFTPMWELDHLAENAMKYKLWPADPGALPQCKGGAAWLGTSFQQGCFDGDAGRYEGYSSIKFSCVDGKTETVSIYASGKLLGREACPWPMILPGSDGYDPAFDFTNQTAPPAAPPTPPLPPAAATLDECLAAAGIEFVDGSNPTALAKASLVWNKLNGTTPAAVAYPADAQQVAAAVLCARDAGVKPVPRSGGHSYMGYSVMPGQLTIDLKHMCGTTVAGDGKTAVVQAGSRLGQLYYNVYNQTGGARAAVGGTCPPVGAGGLLTGGGIGYLTRQYGLACDQVTALNMVDAKGSLLTADSTQNSDLLAAYCGGGGGNFGIITEFTLKLVEVPAQLTLADFKIVTAQALAFLQFMQSTWVKSLDPRIGVFLNTDRDGVQVQAQFTGPQKELQALLESDGVLGGAWNLTRPPAFREMPWIDAVIAKSDFESIISQPEGLLDIAKMEATGREYFKMKSFLVTQALPEEALRVLLAWEPTTESLGADGGGFIEIGVLGPKSAVAAVPANATGYAHRSALFYIQYGSEWQSGQFTGTALALEEGLQRQMDPFLEPQLPAYVNYLDVQVGPSPMESYYGANAGWLSQVKARYDPTGLFSSNPLSIPVGATPPSDAPSTSPSAAPSAVPSAAPSAVPSAAPSGAPGTARTPAPLPSPPSGGVVVLPQDARAAVLALLLCAVVLLM